MAPDMVKMSLGVTAKAFHSLAGERAMPRRPPRLCALMPRANDSEVDIHITQHPSMFQRTSVVPLDWPILVLFWLKDWEIFAMAAGQRKSLRVNCVHVLDEALQ